MPLRRIVGIGAIGAATITAIAVVLISGPTEQVTRPYSSRHTFISSSASICVESSVSGTVTGRRSGSAPLVRWTDVRLIDPTISAAAYRISQGRCDHAHPVTIGARLEQSWSTNGAAPISRQTDQGPASTPLRQFNSGSPISLPDREFPQSVFGWSYPIDGAILTEARTASYSEGFRYRVHITLDVG